MSHEATVNDARYAEAVRRVQEGRYAAAAHALQATVDASPRAAQSLYLLGAVRLLEGRLPEARAMIDRAFSIKRWIKDLTPDVADLVPAATVAVSLMPDWVWPRYEIERQAFAGAGLNLPWVVSRRLAHSDVFFVQVGANDGASSKDPVHRFVIAHSWSGLCVEPMPSAFVRLRETYRGNARIRLANVAVDESDGRRTMYLPSSSETTLASLLPDRNILAKHRSSDLTEMEVECLSFPTLFARYDVQSVDVLQVDTEGYDYYILRSFDLDEHRPLVVNLEMFCLPLEERLACFGLLRRHGYAYRYDGKDLIAVDTSALGEELCLVDRTAGHALPCPDERTVGRAATASDLGAKAATTALAGGTTP